MISEDKLNYLSKGNLDFERRLLNSFIKYTSDDLEMLQEFSDGKNPEKLLYMVHKINSALKSLGCVDSQLRFQKLENSIRSKGESHSKEKIFEAIRHCKATIEEAKSILQKNSK